MPLPGTVRIAPRRARDLPRAVERGLITPNSFIRQTPFPSD